MAVSALTPPLTRADRVLDAVRVEIDTWRAQINAPSTPVRSISCVVHLDEAGLPVYVEFQVRGKREIRKGRPGGLCSPER